MFSNQNQLAHALWKTCLKPKDRVIDATCGNGHDTLALAKYVFPGEVIAIDIQEDALIAARELCPPEFKEHVRWIKCCHSEIRALIEETTTRLVVYNLGYLPGGNKAITTQLETTLRSLESTFEALSKGGMVSIMTYSGHEEGAREEGAILKRIRTLDKRTWYCSVHERVNSDKAPKLLFLQKLGDGVR